LVHSRILVNYRDIRRLIENSKEDEKEVKKMFAGIVMPPRGARLPWVVY